MKVATALTRPAEDLAAAVGGTPLVELDFLAGLPPGTRLFAKLESANPGGSLKDRPVLRMLGDALAEGALTNGRRVLDSTSGNAGIAYALFGAALGVGVTLVVPGNASRERLQRLRAHGAELVLTDPVEGYDFALREARRLAEESPERYFHCDQYSNPGNWLAHYETTGPEILREVRARTGAPPEAFVCGVGTGGSLTGIGRRLREARAELHIACVVPEPFPGIEGLKPLGQPRDIVPAILDSTLIDERAPVGAEQAARTCAELARAGLYVGPSSGAYVTLARSVARRTGARSIVTLLNDTGERYGSTGLWS